MLTRNPKKASSRAVGFRASDAGLEAIEGSAAARILAATGDIVLVIDSAGQIDDVAVADDKLIGEDVADWIGRTWSDIVTVESRPKVAEMLAGAGNDDRPRWRQVNHPGEGGDTPVRYIAIEAGRSGKTIAVGRDLREMAALQQRLIKAQQSMERDHLRLRQAEMRYRMLFETSREAVLIVSAETRMIGEANPAAGILTHHQAQPGTMLPHIFAPESREAVIAMMGAVEVRDDVEPVTARLQEGHGECRVHMSLFRQSRTSNYLVRLEPVGAGTETGESELSEVLEQIPDAFALTDADMTIMAVNDAFLELAGAARQSDLTGLPLQDFLGRPGIDPDIIASELSEHGTIRNYETIFRSAGEGQVEVDVSAVAADDGDEKRFGFTIRTVMRAERDLAELGVSRSVEELTELVGRMSLRDIVRESTDLIERLCIEAALKHTQGNRASAAEVLGLSRQGLYSKLNRYGFGRGDKD